MYWLADVPLLTDAYYFPINKSDSNLDMWLDDDFSQSAVQWLEDRRPIYFVVWRLWEIMLKAMCEYI